SLPLQPRSCDLPWATNRRFLNLMLFRRSLVRGALRSRHLGPPLAPVLGMRAAETSWNGEYFFADFRRFAYWVSFQNGIATRSSVDLNRITSVQGVVSGSSVGQVGGSPPAASSGWIRWPNSSRIWRSACLSSLPFAYRSRAARCAGPTTGAPSPFRESTATYTFPFP